MRDLNISAIANGYLVTLPVNGMPHELAGIIPQISKMAGGIMKDPELAEIETAKEPNPVDEGLTIDQGTIFFADKVDLFGFLDEFLK